MRSNKRGGMEISINTIIVLILAVIILSVGVYFINDMLKPAFKDIDAQREQRRNNFIEELRQTGERFTWDMNFDEMNKAQEETVFYGVKNELEGTDSFSVYFGCLDAIDENIINPEEDISFEYFKETESVVEDGVAVDTVVIKVEPTAKSTIYRCRVLIAKGGMNLDETDLETILSTEDDPAYYASHSFQIRVK